MVSAEYAMRSHGATKAVRVVSEGTIMCSVCGRPAVGEVRGAYYCKYHMRKKYGYLVGI